MAFEAPTFSGLNPISFSASLEHYRTIAITSCVPLKRMLVLNTALPDFEPKITVAISGRGLRLAKMQTRRTWSLSVIGLSIETVSGTEFPLSARGGSESVMRPVCGLAVVLLSKWDFSPYMMRLFAS